MLAHTVTFDYRAKYTIEAQFRQARIAPGTVMRNATDTYSRSEPNQSDFWSEQIMYPNIFAAKVNINKTSSRQIHPTSDSSKVILQLKRKGDQEDNNIPKKCTRL